MQSVNHCTTSRLYAEIHGVGLEVAIKTLDAAWRHGEVERYTVTHTPTYRLYCPPGADIMLPMKNGAGWRFITPGEVVETFKSLIKSYRSRRATVPLARVTRQLGVSGAYGGIVAKLLEKTGVVVTRVRERVLLSVHDVPWYLATVKPPALAPDPRQRRVDDVIIAFYVSPDMLAAMDELVARGRYKSRSDLIRTAVEKLLWRKHGRWP